MLTQCTSLLKMESLKAINFLFLPKLFRPSRIILNSNDMKICRAPYSLISLFILAAACVEPYPPPVTDDEVNFLVVDGSVDDQGGVANVILSRAVPLASEATPPPELNAQVELEDSDGNTYALSEIGDGVYTQSGLPI